MDLPNQTAQNDEIKERRENTSAEDSTGRLENTNAEESTDISRYTKTPENTNTEEPRNISRYTERPENHAGEATDISSYIETPKNTHTKESTDISSYTERPGNSTDISNYTERHGNTNTGELADISIYTPLNLENNDPINPRKCFQGRKGSGGWTSAFLLLVNQGLATLAFFGVSVNLVIFFNRVIGKDNATSANNVSKWTGTVYLCSLIGAFLSDSYWGRYITCIVFQLILVLGLGLLTLSSWIFLIKPTGCGDDIQICVPASTAGIAIFYLAIYLVAFGYGGHQPSIATFGSDQFDECNPNEKSSKDSFFSYFYFALNLGSLFSNTILVYYENIGKWTVGFMASTIAAVIALLSFLLGSSSYRYVKPSGNPLPRVSQVFIAAAKKCHIKPDACVQLYELQGSESAIKGSRKISHTREFECLDKAAVVTEEDRIGPPNPWRLCTVSQVEEAKCIIRMLPVWLCTIIYSVIFTQMATLFVEQGAVMDAKIGKLNLPPASMSAFDICSVLICTGLYRRILVPIAGRLSGNPKGLTELQRMGTGLIIGLLAMVAAGVTEIFRLRRVMQDEDQHPTSSLTILWQIPQYALVGASEVFMYIGQLEFFNGQAPDGIKSLGSSLCMASISLGNFASSMLVNIVVDITEREDRPGWIAEDLNEGHMDRFYFLIAILTAIDFVIYVLCAKWYRGIHLEDTNVITENQGHGDP